MKLHKTKYKVLFFFATFFLSPYIQAGEGFMYGKAEGTGKSIWLELKLELCSKPPSPITVVFDDGSTQEGTAGEVSLRNRRGVSKEHNIEAVDGKFRPVDCEVKYVFKENNSNRAILAIANSSQIKPKKIADWKIVKYEDLDKNVLLKAKPLENMREQMRIGISLGVEFCNVSWDMVEGNLIYGHEEKSKPISIRTEVPVFKFKERCSAKTRGNITHISCNASGDSNDGEKFSFAYIDGKCVSPSMFNPRFLSVEEIPDIWGEIEIDNKNFYVVKQVLSDVLQLRHIFLINSDVSGIYGNYLSPPPSNEAP